MIDHASMNVVTAIEHTKRALADPHRWPKRDQAKLKQALGFLIAVIGDLENLEIECTPEDSWKIT